MRRRGGLWGALLLIVCAGCAKTPAQPQSVSPAPDVYVFTPSPLLELARSERELPPVRRNWLRRRFAPTERPADDTTLDEDGIRRTVRVHPFRLATPEELARAALRDAESRRPRELHPTRYLIRALRVHAPTRAAKRRARKMVDARDGEIARCLAQDLSSQPSVILRAPAALVLEEARRTGAVPTDHTIEISFDGAQPPSIETTPAVNEASERCLVSALTPRPADRPRSARVRLSAFAQGAFGHGGDALHLQLANEAATLGWIELERGAPEEALAYFEDAHWLYHRAEYELLQAMALQEMGKVNMARTRYRRFIEARPYAPEVSMIRERIDALEPEQP